MRATLIHRTAAHAQIRIEPSYFARLFGARVTILSLDFSDPRGEYSHMSCWITAATQRRLSHNNKHDRMALDALEFVPIAVVPEAVALFVDGRRIK